MQASNPAGGYPTMLEDEQSYLSDNSSATIRRRSWRTSRPRPPKLTSQTRPNGADSDSRGAVASTGLHLGCITWPVQGYQRPQSSAGLSAVCRDRRALSLSLRFAESRWEAKCPAGYHEPESGARLHHCEARRLVSAGELNSHRECFRELQLGSPAPIPRAATEF